MSDDSNAQGTPPSEQPSWNAPPAGSTPPPPPPDPSGAMPAPPVPGGGGGVSLSVDNPAALALGVVAVAGVVLGLLLSADVPGGGTVSFWDQMGWTWAVLGIVAAVATLLPVITEELGRYVPDPPRIAVSGLGEMLVPTGAVRLALDHVEAHMLELTPRPPA